jgi:hypothetical protein
LLCDLPSTTPSQRRSCVAAPPPPPFTFIPPLSPSSSPPLRLPNSSFRRRRSLLPSQPAAAALPRNSTTNPDHPDRQRPPPRPLSTTALDSPADDHLLASIERRLFDVTALSSSLAIPTRTLSSSCAALASSAPPCPASTDPRLCPWTACLMLHRSNHVHNTCQH